MFITRLSIYLLLSLVIMPSLLIAQGNESVRLANEYYRLGEVDKAREIYEDLAKNPRNISFIHTNYINVLLELNEFKEADKYLGKVLKWYPDNTNYQIDKGVILVRAGMESEADEYFHGLIDKLADDQFGTRRAVQYMLRQQLTDYAILALETTRTRSQDPFLYAIDLANIFRMQNNKQRMVEEYLNFAIQNPRNLQYVQNTFQVLLTEPEDFENLERLLFDLVQKNPGNDVYAEMLIWVSLQQKNFYGAFIQARALDKRLKLGGSKILNVGVIALNNNDYENAIMIFEYLATNYNETNTGIQARLYRIRARESLVKTRYPVDLVEVQKLVEEYNQFISSFSSNFSTHQASLNKARLFAYYLDRNDSAINIINSLLSTSRMNPNLQAQAKIDLADIYLLDDQPWESALLYAQVDKTMKESPFGYEAKLKNAKLAYYRGNFELAQEYLDILKMATSREIANDALDLSVFIQSNTALDTSTNVMKQYADIELLLYQHKTTLALSEIDRMISEYPGHDLTDDLLYLKAHIKKEAGEFDESRNLLQQIVSEYGQGLLGAKAYYELAIITEEYLNDSERALQIYTDFLKKYPGSIYTTDVRKRLRIIRGDGNLVEQL